MLRIFVPRMRDKSKVMSEARSMLTGRIVDTYTNIVTVKLFARAKDEDAYVREAVDHHTGRFHESLRLNTLFALTLIMLNAWLIAGTGAFAHRAVALRPCQRRHGRHGAADDDADRQRLAAGWPGRSPSIFENIGVVQEGMMTIARPHTLTDQPGRARRSTSRAAKSASRIFASAMAAKAG